ncbi:MAG TPA: VPLPA-CTERM sorting domain-containing protein [Tepidisphaeraceae bacterium]
MKYNLCILAAISAFVAASAAQADTSYFNGFKTSADTSAWQGDSPSAYQSSSDAYSVGSASGTHHAVVTNIDDDYQPSTGPVGAGDGGYGDAGYTFFGSPVSSYPGAFEQSMAIYVNADWAAPTNAGTAAFWLDMSPSNTSGISDLAAENDFAFFTNGTGNVAVEALDGKGPTLTDITISGWYTFQMTFEKGPTYVQEILSVLNSSNNVIGTTTMTMGPNALYPTGALSSDLGGSGYAWLTVWQDGFANDHLAIDSLKTSLVPLPASAWSGLALLVGLAAFGGFKRLRRQMM